MDVISLEELLWHYVSRLNLAIDNIEQQTQDLQNVLMLLDESYKSSVATALQERLEDCKQQTKEVQTHFEDALYFLKRDINDLEELME